MLQYKQYHSLDVSSAINETKSENRASESHNMVYAFV